MAQNPMGFNNDNDLNTTKILFFRVNVAVMMAPVWMSRVVLTWQRPFVQLGQRHARFKTGTSCARPKKRRRNTRTTLKSHARSIQV